MAGAVKDKLIIKLMTEKLKSELAASSQSETSSKESFDWEEWWKNLDNFSDDFMKERIQPPLDKLVNFDE